MFTQRLSMDCTKEQYEKYLEDELLKMGYNEYSINCWEDTNLHYVCNNYNGDLGDLGTIHKDRIEKFNRTYLGSFNAPLFLALAAMTGKAEGNYGEYVIGLNTGRLFKMTENDKILPVYHNLRKATKEEIMAKFGKVEADINYDISKALKEAGDRFCREIKLGSEQIEKVDDAIRLLKSLGFKVMRKTETWEEI